MADALPQREKGTVASINADSGSTTMDDVSDGGVEVGGQTHAIKDMK